jgi:hypothetical protein
MKNLFKVCVVAATLMLVSTSAQAGCRWVWKGIYSHLECSGPSTPPPPSVPQSRDRDVVLNNRTSIYICAAYINGIGATGGWKVIAPWQTTRFYGVAGVRWERCSDGYSGYDNAFFNQDVFLYACVNRDHSTFNSGNYIPANMCGTRWVRFVRTPFGPVNEPAFLDIN